ncbi:hypothetical protein [Sphingomonas sp. RS2018]
MSKPVLALPFAVLLPLIACTSERASAPSLAHRAVEDGSFAEPTRPVAVATPDATLDATIAARSAAVDTAVRGFETSVRAIEPRILRGAKAREGSEAWLDAQSAVGELGQARSAVDTALAALEELAIARESSLAPRYPALVAALTSAQAKVDAVEATENRLRARLP